MVAKQCLKGTFGKYTWGGRNRSGREDFFPWNATNQQKAAMELKWGRVKKRMKRNFIIMFRTIKRWLQGDLKSIRTIRTFLKKNASVQWTILKTLKLQYEPKHYMNEKYNTNY